MEEQTVHANILARSPDFELRDARDDLGNECAREEAVSSFRPSSACASLVHTCDDSGDTICGIVVVISAVLGSSDGAERDPFPQQEDCPWERWRTSLESASATLRAIEADRDAQSAGESATPGMQHAKPGTAVCGQ